MTRSPLNRSGWQDRAAGETVKLGFLPGPVQAAAASIICLPFTQAS